MAECAECAEYCELKCGFINRLMVNRDVVIDDSFVAFDFVTK